MCVIIDMPAGAMFPANELEVAFENNPDGFGVMWTDKGRVETLKYPKGTFSTLLDVLASFDPDQSIVLHLRYATVGVVKEMNTHPHQVLCKSQHGIDLWMMHNGTIYDAVDDGAKSDTLSFVDNELKPILAKCPALILYPAFQRFIEKRVGSGNKLVFLDSAGNVTKINEDQGVERNGCWCSNAYSFKPGYRKPYTSSTVSTSKYAESSAAWEEWYDKYYEERDTPEDNNPYGIVAWDGSTSDLLVMNEAEIYDVIIQQPDDVLDWILEMINHPKSYGGYS